DGERVPDLDDVMGEAGDKKRRRQQQEFGPRGWDVARRLSFLELETGHFAKQPTAQRPGAVILAGDGERGRDCSHVSPRASVSHRNIKCATFSREREREV